MGSLAELQVGQQHPSPLHLPLQVPAAPGQGESETRACRRSQPPSAAAIQLRAQGRDLGWREKQFHHIFIITMSIEHTAAAHRLRLSLSSVNPNQIPNPKHLNPALSSFRGSSINMLPTTSQEGGYGWQNLGDDMQITILSILARRGNTPASKQCTRLHESCSCRQAP